MALNTASSHCLLSREPTVYLCLGVLSGWSPALHADHSLPVLSLIPSPRVFPSSESVSLSQRPNYPCTPLDKNTEAAATSLNPFMPSGLSHPSKMDQSISKIRDV
ncbi:hypothetical protein DPMN_010282 [Dreissena polymorpha]|uniref:Uncharacterized protein n=1 Tax=Dreissena polymorpha TaxID=45954 RepID=A0A9D4MZN4_DREPO|nr:hypothetical protein DPMN_010282 [Dreissena polymorpha]